MSAPHASCSPEHQRTGGDGVAAPIRSCLARWMVVVAAWGALHFGAVPALALPAPWQPRALGDRLLSDGPFVGTVAVAHLAVTSVGAYLLVLLTAGFAVRLAGSLLPGTGSGGVSLGLHFLVRLSLPGSRSLLAWSLGMASLGGSMVATNTAYAAEGSPPPAMTMTAAPAGGASGGESAPPVMSVLPARSGLSGAAPPKAGLPKAGGPKVVPAKTAPSETAPSETAPSETVPPKTVPSGAVPSETVPAKTVPPKTVPSDTVPPRDGAPTATRAGTWIVRPGDHLWSIAQRTLAAARGVPPPLGQVGPYWWAVVTANRPTLPDPADIDLLFPGDVVTLPPLPPAP